MQFAQGIHAARVGLRWTGHSSLVGIPVVGHLFNTVRGPFRFINTVNFLGLRLVSPVMNVTAQVFGLPAHPLLVHGVLVLLPLVVLALVLAQFWPAARMRLGLVTPAAALVVAVLVPVTISAGQSLKELVGPLPAVLEHERYGRMLWPWSLGLFVIAAAQWFWFRRAESVRGERTTTLVQVALSTAVVVVAAGSLTVLVLTGHSGSRAVWGSLVGE